MLSGQKLYSLMHTARRAGWRRMFYRFERLARLRLINPRLGRYVYPLQEPTPSTLPQATPAQLALLNEFVQLRASNTAWDATHQTLTLLNQTPIALKPPVAWHTNPSTDPLWLFHLHGWDWAWPLLRSENHKAYWLALWRDWIAQAPVGESLAWEPYPTARRLIVWCAAWHLLPGDVVMAAAIQQHAQYLLDHLERDLDNNHLIANAKALSWAGLLFASLPQANHWRIVGLTTLWAALQQQVGEGGGHKENSTSYHLAVWLDALETALLCRAGAIPVPPTIDQLLLQMGDYVKALLRPDQRLPLLNDSVEDEPAPAATLLAFFAAKMVDASTAALGATASPLSVASWRHWDTPPYLLFRHGPIYLLFDAGDLGMPHCPGHGHADALSFELWHGEQPLVIDPGTYQYPAGEWRTYFRQTAAHSTATVDQLDQSTFTGPFRVSNMAHTELLTTTCTAGQLVIGARHDGYMRLPDPVIHQRYLYWQDNHGVIEDTFLGKASHEIALYLHLAPSYAEVQNPSTILVSYPNGLRLQIVIECAVASQLTIETGWLSRHWYQKESTPVVAYRFTAQLPITIQTKLEITV